VDYKGLYIIFQKAKNILDKIIQSPKVSPKNFLKLLFFELRSRNEFKIPTIKIIL